MVFIFDTLLLCDAFLISFVDLLACRSTTRSVLDNCYCGQVATTGVMISDMISDVPSFKHSRNAARRDFVHNFQALSYITSSECQKY